MILNSYAILLAFIAVLRLVLCVLAIGISAHEWLRSRRSVASADRDAIGNRYYLLFLITIVLIGMNLASWPLLYLLLQGYVTEFPGVMCIYGVTRIGEHSLGPARHLPTLLMLLQMSKPLVVFLGGAWFALHIVNRRTATGPLLPRLMFTLVPVCMLAAADAAAELAYVAIAKTEEAPAAGCCTVERIGDRYLPDGITGEPARNWLIAAFVAVNGVLVLTLGAFASRSARLPGNVGLSVVFITAIAAAAIGLVFLVDVAAPTLLRQPFHHCPYDLLPRVPEAIIAIALYVCGGFAIGWAWTVRCFGSHRETESFLTGDVQGWLRLGLWCYIAAIGMLFLELALAL